MKNYIDPKEYLRDAWRLARRVLDSGWRPDTLLALWRGGAPVGAAVHEFFDYLGVKMRHMPVKCASYTAIGENSGGVRFECADEVFARIRPGERVLVVDDVFDTGKTAAAVKARLDGLGAEMRLACVYWKPGKNLTALKPDYYTRALDDGWIVFPHEMDGLTREELAEKDPMLAALVAGDASVRDDFHVDNQNINRPSKKETEATK